MHPDTYDGCVGCYIMTLRAKRCEYLCIDKSLHFLMCVYGVMCPDMYIWWI